MNLLLLLSALLSALTGIGGSVRAPDVAQAVAGASVARAAPATAQVRVASRPAAALPTPVDAAAATIAPTSGPARRVALWTARRRE